MYNHNITPKNVNFYRILFLFFFSFSWFILNPDSQVEEEFLSEWWKLHPPACENDDTGLAQPLSYVRSSQWPLKFLLQNFWISWINLKFPPTGWLVDQVSRSSCSWSRFSVISWQERPLGTTQCTILRICNYWCLCDIMLYTHQNEGAMQKYEVWLTTKHNWPESRAIYQVDY